MVMTHPPLAIAIVALGLGCSAAAPAPAPAKPAPSPHAAAPPPPSASASASARASTAAAPPEAPHALTDDPKPNEIGAALEKACAAKELSACDQLGLMLEGDELERDYPTAASLYRKACDAGLASACGHLAVLRFKSEPGIEATTEAEFSAARALAEKACNGGHANSCSFLGSLYFLADHVTKDIPKARQLGEKGCVMGDFHGCEFAGLAWALKWGGVPGNEERAIKYQTRAFEMVKEKCASTGKWCAKLADYYEKGHGVIQDADMAFRVLEDTCHGKKRPEACNDLGYAYLHGTGTQIDGPKAFAAFEAGCKGSISVSCYEASVFYMFGQGMPVDLAKAFSLLNRSCALGHALGCDIMGTHYLEGKGVERSNEKALAARRKACGWRSAPSCRMLGFWLILHDGDDVPAGEGRREAATHWARACDIEGAENCFWLGLLYDRGWGVPKDKIKAQELASRACKGDQKEACDWLHNRTIVPDWVKRREAKDAKKTP